MMRPRLSIPSRLLAGFFANLALLALGFWLVFPAQFGAAAWSSCAAAVARPLQLLVRDGACVGPLVLLGGRPGAGRAIRARLAATAAVDALGPAHGRRIVFRSQAVALRGAGCAGALGRD